MGDGVISEIDLVDNEVAWTLRVSEGTDTRSAESAMGIAASRDGRWIYTGDAARDELVIVDGDARAIVARIPLPHQVHGIDIGPRGDLLWVWIAVMKGAIAKNASIFNSHRMMRRYASDAYSR